MTSVASRDKNSMRGLHNFITDIRNAPSKEVEEKRITKELAHIRKEFKENKGIDGYQRRKYVCKLLYIYLLGYDIDFGHMEALTLLSSIKYQEKQVGYTALGLLLHENHEMIPLIINSFNEDLQHRNDFFQACSLSGIANIGGKEMAESLGPQVARLLLANGIAPQVRKRATVAFLRLYKKNNGLLTTIDGFNDKLLQALSDETDYGSIMGIVTLLNGIVLDGTQGWEGAVNKSIAIMARIIISRDYTKDYVYYSIPCPWLQVKLLRLLRNFAPPTDAQAKAKLNEILLIIFSSAESAKSGSLNQKNALNCILFEAINLVVAYDSDTNMLRQVASLLGRFVSVKETNIRYLALDAMSHLARLSSDTAQLIKRYQDVVIQSLRDADISIRKRALDLLYGMCDSSSSMKIVSELLHYLAGADYAIREELVLKIAILAEKFAADFSWYVDVILQLIAQAGDFVSDAIWHRLIAIVTNHEETQQHAAQTAFKELQSPQAHETMVKVGGYLLGEFGHLISENPDSSPQAQFAVLHNKFHQASLNTRALLLTTYIKFVNLFPELTQQIQPVFRQYASFLDAEIQQRSWEYLKLSVVPEQLMQTVLDAMPPWPEKEENQISNLMVDPREAASAARRREGGAVDGGSAGAGAGAGGPPAGAPRAGAASPLDGDLLGLDLGAPSGPAAPVVSQPRVTSPITTGGSDLVGDLASLGGLFGGGAGAAGAAPTPVPPAGGASIFGGSDPFAPMGGAASSPFGAPAAAGPIPQPLDPELQAKVTAAYRRLCLVADGVLFEDSTLQIGLKSEYQAQGVGKITLFFGNSSMTPLTNFAATVASTESISFQAQPVANTIAPRTQAQQLIGFVLNTPDIAQPPLIRISYNTATRPVCFELKLPVLVAKFFTPLTLSAPDFFAKWRDLSEAQEVIKSNRPLDMAWLHKVAGEGLKMAVLKGVDPNPANFVAAATLQTAFSQVLCLTRVETNPAANAIRITVHTQNPAVTTELKDLLVSFLP